MPSARLLSVLPVPAMVFDSSGTVWANGEAAALFSLPADGLAGPAEVTDAFRDGPLEPESRQRLDTLVRAGASPTPVPLRWGPAPPYVWVTAAARRVDEERVLVALVDETEVHRLDAVLSAFDNAAFATDADRRILWMSRGMTSAYGTEHLLGKDSLTQMHPDDLEAARDLFVAARAHPRRKVRGSGRVASADFPDVWWHVDFTVMDLLEDPAVGAIVSTFGPHAEAPRSDADGADGSGDDESTGFEANRATDVMPVGIVQAMPDGSCYYRNRLAVQQLGEIVHGDPPERWINRAREEDREPLLRALKEAAAGNRSDPVIVSYPGLHTAKWYRIELTPQYDQRGRPAGWIATSLDITPEVEARDELYRAQQHLWELANHDALTGLPNRPAIIDRINAALARAQREQHPVALLYCDLDGFKPVNDNHGHEAGDEVLRIVARRMSNAVRATDAVGRLGGDEFVVLCETFESDADVVQVAQRVRAQVRAPLRVASALAGELHGSDGGDGAGRSDPMVELTLDVTIGVAVAGPYETSASLLSRADRSMYDAKPRHR